MDCIVGRIRRWGRTGRSKGGTTDVVLGDTVYYDASFGPLISDNVAIGGNATISWGRLSGAARAFPVIDPDSNVQRG